MAKKTTNSAKSAAKSKATTEKKPSATKMSAGKTMSTNVVKVSRSNTSATTSKSSKKSTGRPAAKSHQRTDKKVAAPKPSDPPDGVGDNKGLKLVQQHSESMVVKLAAKRGGSDGHKKSQPLLRYRPQSIEAPPQQELSDQQLRKVKSGLSRKNLKQYREILLAKRAEILGNVEALEIDARKEDGSGISYDHLADAGSDNYEQDFNLGLVESERKMLLQIDEAILRIEKGIYGVCVETGVAIGKARLRAKPWAKYCIDVAREKERQGLL